MNSAIGLNICAIIARIRRYKSIIKKYDGYQRVLASLIYKFFNKKSSGTYTSVGAVKSEIMSSQELAEELQKTIVRKLEKRKVYLIFRDKIWGVDLAYMQLISKFNKGICFLLCVTDIFSKYTCAAPLKDKKDITITNAFQKILHLFLNLCKPNKMWAAKGSEFYNGSIKLWLRGNNIERYSTHNEEKSVVVERFIRTLKNEI